MYANHLKSIFGITALIGIFAVTISTLFSLSPNLNNSVSEGEVAGASTSGGVNISSQKIELNQTSESEYAALIEFSQIDVNNQISKFPIQVSNNNEEDFNLTTSFRTHGISSSNFQVLIGKSNLNPSDSLKIEALTSKDYILYVISQDRVNFPVSLEIRLAAEER